VGSEYRTVNVEAQERDPDSVLNFYRRLLRVRKGRKCVIEGTTEWIGFDSDEQVSYVRRYEDEALVSLNNFTEHPVAVEIPRDLPGPLEILLSNCGRSGTAEGELILEPWESVVAATR
jgi:glycosidase